MQGLRQGSQEDQPLSGLRYRWLFCAVQSLIEEMSRKAHDLHCALTTAGGAAVEQNQRRDVAQSAERTLWEREAACANHVISTSGLVRILSPNSNREVRLSHQSRARLNAY